MTWQIVPSEIESGRSGSDIIEQFKQGGDLALDAGHDVALVRQESEVALAAIETIVAVASGSSSSGTALAAHAALMGIEQQIRFARESLHV